MAQSVFGALHAPKSTTNKSAYPTLLVFYPGRSRQSITESLPPQCNLRHRRANDDGNDYFQPSNLEITEITIDNPAHNVIPAEASGRFNIRFNDLHTSQSLTEWMHAKLSSALGEGSARYDLGLHVTGESFLTPPGPLSELLVAAVEQVTGRTPELSTTGGTSDARFIKDHCPVAEFGLVGQTMHQTNENVACADIDTLSEIYRVVLEKYFAATPA